MMAKGKGKTAVKTAKKQPARHDSQRAYIVSGEGTDDDIRARCFAEVPGFADMSAKVQGELVRLMRVFWEMPPTPRLELREREGVTQVAGPEGSNVTLSALRAVEAFASSSQELTDRRVLELVMGARARGEMTTECLMADLAFVVGGGAKDTVQAALLTQMAVTHSAALKALNMSMRADYIDQVTQTGNLANRLLNTFTRQAEVLAKLQRGGEQVVKHVHIDNRHGGQTVVTDTVQTGGSSAGSEEQAYATAAIGPGATLLGQNAQGNGMPVASYTGPETLPHARVRVGIGGEEGQ